MPRVRKVAEGGAEKFRFKEAGEDPEYDAWFREQVQIGIDEADGGELIPHETIRREWRKWRGELLRRAQRKSDPSQMDRKGQPRPPFAAYGHRC